jgi:D-cysteine desulfhydrase
MIDDSLHDRALFKRFPELAGKLPFITLGEMPTPVKPLASLGKIIGVADLWVKCDDISAPVYGGNKIRKLEFLLADALEQGCSTVLTFGGLGSNHALATSINCQRLGLQCIAILTPEPATDAVRRTLRYHQHLGTRLEVANRYADARATADRVIAELGTANVYEVPFGGSSWVGATGFVNAGLELAAQIDAHQSGRPDVIYLGCGTAGSTAGLALGLQLAGLATRIEAIQVTPESIQPARLFRQLFAATGQHLHALDLSIRPEELSSSRVNVRQDQLGEGYAIPTEAAVEAAQLMLQAENMPSSLTYTGKTMAALIADSRAGLLADKRVLFWNTYNSRPYPELPDDDSWHALPEDLQHVFKPC